MRRMKSNSDEGCGREVGENAHGEEGAFEKAYRKK